MIVNKQINLEQLEKELINSGITIKGLGMNDDYLHTYDENGIVLDLPFESRTIIELHNAITLQYPTTAERLQMAEDTLIFLLMGGM